MGVGRGDGGWAAGAWGLAPVPVLLKACMEMQREGPVQQEAECSGCRWPMGARPSWVRGGQGRVGLWVVPRALRSRTPSPRPPAMSHLNGHKLHGKPVRITLSKHQSRSCPERARRTRA